MELRMRLAHRRPALTSIAANRYPAILDALADANVEDAMFIRIVWGGRSRADCLRNAQHVQRISKERADDLGIQGPDFHRMTRSLFDKAD
jgi:hypothetical protein